MTTVLNGTGGTELKTFASLLNLPNAASIENQFHRIEKDLIIPTAIQLQEEALNEALIEEGKLEMQKLGYSDEDIKQWLMEDSWEGRNAICQVGLHASYDMGWQKRGSGNSYSSTSGHGFLVGTNTNKLLAVSIKSTRCRKCEDAQKKGNAVEEHVCFINYEGSSGGMEPEASLEMIKNIQNDTKNAIFIATICADDTTTLTCIIKNARDGGKLPTI